MSLIRDLFASPDLKEQREAFDEALEAYKKAQANQDESARKRETMSAKRKLDGVYWNSLEALTKRAMEREQFAFNKAESLFINFGLIDECLLAPLEKEKYKDLPLLEQYEQYFSGLLMPSKDSYANVLLFTDFIIKMEQDMEVFAASEQESEDEDDDAWEDDDAKKYKMVRLKIYQKLTPQLRNIPGSQKIMPTLLTGKFDRQVDRVAAMLEVAPDQVSEAMRRLVTVRDVLMRQLYAGAHSPQMKQMVDMLHKVSAKLIEKRKSVKSAAVSTTEEGKKEFRDQFVKHELKRLRSLLMIGGMEAKMPYTSPLIQETRGSITKVSVGRIMETVYECDPHIPESLSIVIVPYTGSGFFEWDKNVLILPVVPAATPEEAIVRACANYRILTDNLEHNGELKRQYEKAMEKGSFKERFIKDYQLWATRVSKGHSGVFNEKRLDFFMKFVGPTQETLFAGSKYLNLPRGQVRKVAKELLATDDKNQEQNHELAICFWLLEEKKQALKFMEEALYGGMPSPKMLLGLAVLYIEKGDFKTAKRYCQNLLKGYKSTLFESYAKRLLQTKGM